ncbi:putative RNA-binding protein containing a PIN domain protein [Streptococcus varani]|jgi:hypothetical protein|uniref:Putative RNA-binding protein containing a PIN domain protein n=1 Tax=Streptococcus varani TaxID=1608583 RepID=A0A0E4CTP5_9STRE|nr:NYN domain-containing protein [Streptococcus varani]CQR25992.1 putative RNA-binding protein containing a PIN domain protein [Streptococcus varani]
MKEKILLVDGYNMIAFWQSTKQAFRQGKLDEARSILLNKLSNYASFEEMEIICVFDAQYVPGLRQRYDQYNVTVIFTEEEETADSYIERMSAELNTSRLTVSVATSDLNEQWVVFSQGALRVSARELEKRVSAVKKEVDSFVDQVELYTPRLNPWTKGNYEALQDLMKDL